jgi:hypothetical protein
MAANILIVLGLVGTILHWTGLSPTGAFLCLVASLIVAATVSARFLWAYLRGSE